MEEVVTSEGECIPLFTGDPFLSFKQRLNINFASAKSDDKTADTSPLISGRLAYSDRYRRPEKLKNAKSSFQFNTTLNLTRFVQAQKFKLRTPHIRPPHLLTPLALAIEADENWFKEEVPLKKATNLLIGPWTKYAYAMSRPLSRHLSRYLWLVDAVLDRALTNSSRDGLSRPLRTKYYSLQEIEFYWEFDCENPITYVSAALPKIRSASSRFFEGQVEIQRIEQTASITEYQSPSIKAKIAKGTWLRCYAKTTRRVRFEIVLDSDIIGQLSNGQTATSRTELCSKVEVLANYSAKKLNPILGLLNGPPKPISTLSAIRLLSEINLATGDPYLAEAIVGSLVVFDRVALYGNSPFKDAIHNLRDKGVLCTVVPKSRNYSVTPAYRSALDQLKHSFSALS